MCRTTTILPPKYDKQSLQVLYETHCKPCPRQPGKYIDSCGKYAMADQCYDHGFGSYEAKEGEQKS
jgi:hypothetical protein